MKISTRRDALFAQLQTVTRVASTRSAVQALSGVQLASAGRCASSCGRPTWRSACASRSRARSSARAPSSCRRGCSSTSSARCPATSVSLELRPAEQDVEIVAGSATFHIRTLRSEDFPPLPEPDGDERLDVPGAAFVETVLKVAALGVARRDAPGAHRHPRLGRRAGAADGRDRLLPPGGQGDAARGAAGAARSRPTCRRGRCRS